MDDRTLNFLQQSNQEPIRHPFLTKMVEMLEALEMTMGEARDLMITVVVDNATMIDMKMNHAMSDVKGEEPEHILGFPIKREIIGSNNCHLLYPVQHMSHLQGELKNCIMCTMYGGSARQGHFTPEIWSQAKDYIERSHDGTLGDKFFDETWEEPTVSLEQLTINLARTALKDMQRNTEEELMEQSREFARSVASNYRPTTYVAPEPDMLLITDDQVGSDDQ